MYSILLRIDNLKNEEAKGYKYSNDISFKIYLLKIKLNSSYSSNQNMSIHNTVAPKISPRWYKLLPSAILAQDASVDQNKIPRHFQTFIL